VVGGFGLPAGKTKPVVVDLVGKINVGDPRIRITTNFEVYWDRIAFAQRVDRDGVALTTRRLAPSSATLQFGGFGEEYLPAPNGPHFYSYAANKRHPWPHRKQGDRAVPVAWDAPAGARTAYGDVRELLASVDGAMVTIGDGDEIALSFDVSTLPPVAAGYRRHYFLHSTGWDRDGDANVTHGQTLLPLPWMGMNDNPFANEPNPAQQADMARRSRLTRWVFADRWRRAIESALPLTSR
jgi:hypothetical protein